LHAACLLQAYATVTSKILLCGFKTSAVQLPPPAYVSSIMLYDLGTPKSDGSDSIIKSELRP
jgi:hypothetical protein